MTAVEVARLVRTHRFRYASEELLQEGLAGALAAAGLPVEREVRLESGGRIDLVVGRVGVEVKVAGSTADLRRQVRGYLRSHRIDELVVVTNRVRHLSLGAFVDGKRVEVVTLAGAGL